MISYERFCIYGFCVGYPDNWRVELNPKSNRKSGDVGFTSPKGMTIFVSWRPLNGIKKQDPYVAEHAKNVLGRIKEGSGAEAIEVIQMRSISVNLHKAILSHAKIIARPRSMIPFRRKKTSQQSIFHMHLYCEPSERYFSIYGRPTSEKSLEQKDILEKMSNSLICHDTREE